MTSGDQICEIIPAIFFGLWELKIREADEDKGGGQNLYTKSNYIALAQVFPCLVLHTFTTVVSR